MSPMPILDASLEFHLAEVIDQYGVGEEDGAISVDLFKGASLKRASDLIDLDKKVEDPTMGEPFGGASGMDKADKEYVSKCKEHDDYVASVVGVSLAGAEVDAIYKELDGSDVDGHPADDSVEAILNLSEAFGVVDTPLSGDIDISIGFASAWQDQASAGISAYKERTTTIAGPHKKTIGQGGDLVLLETSSGSLAFVHGMSEGNRKGRIAELDAGNRVKTIVNVLGKRFETDLDDAIIIHSAVGTTMRLSRDAARTKVQKVGPTAQHRPQIRDAIMVLRDMWLISKDGPMQIDYCELCGKGANAVCSGCATTCWLCRMSSHPACAANLLSKIDITRSPNPELAMHLVHEPFSPSCS